MNDDDYLDLCEQKCAAVNRSVGNRVDCCTCPGNVPMNDRFFGCTNVRGLLLGSHDAHDLRPPALAADKKMEKMWWQKVIIGNSFARIVTLNWRSDLLGRREEGEEDAASLDLRTLLRWLVFKLQFPIPKKFVSASWDVMYTTYLSVKVAPFSSDAEDHRVCFYFLLLS